ncbi:hypothetical protein KI688_000448 [Linnemannia hyalina]|uniref:Uncharacterized protein n=1 Tax=Linnemannia hyalina TaxID=64524 RepID=A0A9P7Y6W1_9FUNG|nr:hypothetical protein KI688_000448 [Linnemannia hyalina]
MPGCRDKSNWNRASHADWDQALLVIYGDASPDPGAEIDVELDDPVALNKNVTNISNTLMREYATNINNIWDGPIYQQLRRYVVRYVLRISLRPISERNYQENKRQREIDKAEQRKLESDSANERECGTLRVWKRRDSELFDQLDRAVTTGRPNERVNKVLKLIGIHMSRHPSKKEAPASHRVSSGMEYEYESDSEFDESDSEDGDCGDDQENLTGTPKTKEPTSWKLKGLEAVAIKLLDRVESLDGVTDAMVRNELYEPELYMAEEIVATRMSQSHRDAIFSAFLDRNVIDEACKAYGLVFAHWLIFVDRYTVRIQGRQVTSGTKCHVVTSTYDDKRKKKQRPPGSIDWGQELSTSGHTHVSAKTEADRLKVGQEALLAKLKPLRKRLQVIESD